MEKIKIRETVDFNCYDLDNLSLTEVVKYFQDLEVEFIRKGLSDVRLKIDLFGGDDSIIVGEREETDAEYKERTDLEERLKEIQNQREQQELEKYEKRDTGFSGFSADV